MKIASWNVNSLNKRLGHLADWLNESGVDVACLQETKMEDHKFPAQELEDLGFESVFTGQKSYNGVAIVSRKGLSEVQTEFDNVLNASDQRRVIAATVDGVRIINVYVVNGQALGSEKFEFKMRWLKALRDVVRTQLAQFPKLVLLGDFNIAPADLDVHDPKAWENQIHCSTDERDQLKAICALGLSDSYRLMHESERAFSWWDYRQAAFARNLGLRIDLVLVSDALKPGLKQAGIDRSPRERESPSDHTPVWIEIE
jgi:exodeoxyribonuclease III